MKLLISKKIIGLFHTRRTVIYALVFGTFFFDMIVANDMSLITFLPLTYIVLHSTRNDKYLAFTFIMQTIAFNYSFNNSWFRCIRLRKSSNC